MTTSTAEPEPATLPEAKILRTIHAYAIEWGYRYVAGKTWGSMTPNKQFSFLPGCFDKCLARRPDIPLTRDLDGKSIFARTGDNTLVLTSDDTGLLASVVLLDTPLNRELCQLIDDGKIRGWSHKAIPLFFGWRSVVEGDTHIDEHRDATLAEVTLVVRKWPRAKTRKTPIFLFGGPQPKGMAHVL